MTLNGDTISNNTGSGNGGGLYIDTGTASLTNETITGNSANPGSGGGIYINSGTNTLSGNTIGSNTATVGNGGGIAINGGTNTFSGNTITGNSVSNNGFYPQFGGGAAIFNGTNTFTGDSATDNVATNSNGGAFYLDGGSNTFDGVTANQNTATWSSGVEAPNGSGGAFYIAAGTNTLTGGSINQNGAYESGGVVVTSLPLAGPLNPALTPANSAPHVSATSPNNFTQETIDGNSASEAGGGLALENTFYQALPTPSANVTDSTISGNRVTGTVGITSFLGDGGAILSNGCNALTLTNDTISGNVANDGGGYLAVNCFNSPPPASRRSSSTPSTPTPRGIRPGPGTFNRCRATSRPPRRPRRSSPVASPVPLPRTACSVERATASRRSATT